MVEPAERRPHLTPSLSGAEVQRWYWLKSELLDFARDLGVSTSGSKDDLAARIVARLDGHRSQPPRGRSRQAREPQLHGELYAETVIPPGQRASQVLREWFTAQLGPSFHFDRYMRDFLAAADGIATLGDAVERWHTTRDQPVTTIDPQFELNRFTRAWHTQHPGGTRAELLVDWQRYRSVPVDVRGRA